jgi:hypothetical protein
MANISVRRNYCFVRRVIIKRNPFIRQSILSFLSKLPELEDSSPGSFDFDVARTDQHRLDLRFLYLHSIRSKSLKIFQMETWHFLSQEDPSFSTNILRSKMWSSPSQRLADYQSRCKEYQSGYLTVRILGLIKRREERISRVVKIRLWLQICKKYERERERNNWP